MFRKLRTIIYYTPDIEAGRKWYSDILEKEPYFNEPFYVGFDINGYELGLNPDASEITEGNQTVCYWDVENVQEEVDRLLGKGATLVQERTNVGGNIHVGIVKDPFGNHLGLIEGA